MAAIGELVSRWCSAPAGVRSREAWESRQRLEVEDEEETLDFDPVVQKISKESRDFTRR